MKAALHDATQYGADLVIFPECNLTGYCLDRTAEIAVSPECDSIASIEHMAAELGIALGYGFIERGTKDNAAANTYIIVSGANRLVYRKTHLGAIERNAFCAGNDLPVIPVNGVYIGVQLCWEAHIPEITTTLRAKGAEVVVMPHASRLEHARRLALWDRYLPARALDNGLFVVACNAFWQNEDGTKAGGGIVAYNPKGVLIANQSRSRIAESGPYSTALYNLHGQLPREVSDEGMSSRSYYDCKRPELYQ